MTITENETVLRPIIPAAGPAAPPCAPGDVALFAAPIQVGTPVPGFNSEVHGIAVDERYVYATSGTTGIENATTRPEYTKRDPAIVRRLERRVAEHYPARYERCLRGLEPLASG